MASSRAGISGVAVGVAAGGAVLVYAGFRGISPLQALRDTASGRPPAVEARSTTPPIISSSSGFGDAKRSLVVAAAQKYAGDTYSQAKRTVPGFSDCSSFVDKALRDAGIPPPFSAWANTTMFRLSPEWRTIPADRASPGDIAISAGHMVLVTAKGGGSAIGQQRSGVNVRTGSVASLMGNQSYVYRTWTGYGPTPTAGSGSGSGGGGSW